MTTEGSGPHDSYGPEHLRRDLGVSQETAERLETHRALIEAWSPRLNLIGPREMADYWRRHVLDSAQLIALAPEAKTWLDLGSGAGLPGLVIAICLKEGSVDLVERSARKAEFLREAIRATGAPARVLEMQASELGGRGRYDAVVARAFAPLKRLIASARPWLARGAVGLFPKGADYASELAAAGFPRKGGGFQGLIAEALASRSDARARIIRIHKA
jgi:16S rRNA (guanine527-N7)-methyltransferase